MAINPTPITPPPAPADVRQQEDGGSACGTGDAWARLTEHERGAWEGFLQAHAEIHVELEQELQAAHQLSYTDYFALVTLEKTERGSLRMHDLAGPVRLTRSGLTRLVERLGGVGLIERPPCPDDARGTEARITPEGRALVQAASETHLAGVRSRFLERFSPEELRALGEQFSRLTA